MTTTQFTHARAVLEAEKLVKQFQTAYPDDPHVAAGKLAGLAPAIDRAMLNHPSTQDVFNLCVVELARAMNMAARHEGNSGYTKALKALERSGLASSGGFALSQRLAIAHDYPALFAPNLALAHLRSSPLRGDITFQLR